MPKRKKELGRPLKKRYPPRMDATPEEMAQAMFSLPRRSQVGVHGSWPGGDGIPLRRLRARSLLSQHSIPRWALRDLPCCRSPSSRYAG